MTNIENKPIKKRLSSVRIFYITTGILFLLDSLFIYFYAPRPDSLFGSGLMFGTGLTLSLLGGIVDDNN